MKKQLLLTAALLALSGCAGGNGIAGIGGSRLGHAQDIAATNGMTMRTVAAPPFNLTVFERISAPGQTASVYIEGDGLAWISRRQASLDPTPKNPLALELAALDRSANVIYVARPCQYTKLTQTGPCPQSYWTSARFAPETVASINVALDDVKRRAHISAFDLTGFSGGGAIAPLLAARRDDVRTLRTVAGNLDHDAVNREHGTTPLAGSLNARDVAAQIAHIPQLHFIGSEDKIVSPNIYQSYLSQVPANMRGCIHSQTVKAEHEDGWVSAWPSLVKAVPRCVP